MSYLHVTLDIENTQARKFFGTVPNVLTIMYWYITDLRVNRRNCNTQYWQQSLETSMLKPNLQHWPNLGQ